MWNKMSEHPNFVLSLQYNMSLRFACLLETCYHFQRNKHTEHLKNSYFCLNLLCCIQIHTICILFLV
jgi:hypothetical protein